MNKKNINVSGSALNNSNYNRGSYGKSSKRQRDQDENFDDEDNFFDLDDDPISQYKQ